MKKVSYNVSAALFAIAILFSAASCSKQETPNLPEEPSTGQTITLTASMELPESDTKTSLNSDNTVWWSSTDKISVFFGGYTTRSKFKLINGSGTTLASFSGPMPKPMPSTIYAVYPYNDNTTISGSTVTLNLTAVQTYKEGTFDERMNPAVAYTSTGGNLQFKNLCGVLKLQIKSSPTHIYHINKISLYSKTDKLSGKGTVVMTDATPTLRMSSTASNTVTLDVGDVSIGDTKIKTFYIVVPPTTGKLKVTIQYSEQSKMVKTTSATINRNKIRSMQELIYQADDIVDLSSVGTANCYIVPAAGDYSFDATVIGNGLSGFLPDVADETKKFHKTTSAENAAIAPGSAQVLWQDDSDLITNVSVTANGQINFTASTGKGNALIAAYASNDCTGDILWSWHIWCTDQPTDQKYVTADRTGEDSGKYPSKELWLLDRNLGATSTFFGEASYGLHYQWGRKDPFSRNSSNLSTSNTSPEEGTIANTISHPNTYYMQPEDPFDWHYTTSGDNVSNDYLWGNPEGNNASYTAAKTIYDPCPPGYMVAPKDTWTYFSTSTGNWNYTGYTFNTNSDGGTTWYPASGLRGHYLGYLSDSGSAGYYWSSAPGSNSYGHAGTLTFNSEYVFPIGSDSHAYGFSVRCARW